VSHSHWQRVYRQRRDWADLTNVALLQAKLKLTKPLPPVWVHPIFTFGVTRTRDPINFMPTVKPVIDTLVRHGWWPDDNPRYVDYIAPVAVIVKGCLENLTLRFYERPTDG
jgi:hypothetical protein